MSVFPNSQILEVTHYGPNTPMPEGTVLTVEFELDGQRYTALNAGPQFTFDEAISFQIDCASQEEVDRYWAALTADGDRSPNVAGSRTSSGSPGRWSRVS